MAKVVRVARDGGNVIVQTDGAYVRVHVETLSTELSADLVSLTAGGGWRMATAAEAEKMPSIIEIAEAATLSLDVAELSTNENKRIYRVPRVVQDEANRALSWATKRGPLDPALHAMATKLSTSKSVDISTIQQVSDLRAALKIDKLQGGFTLSSEDGGVPNGDRIVWSALGGDFGERWTTRVASSHVAITADAAYDPSMVYFAGGDDPESTEVDTLYMLDQGGIFYRREAQAWTNIGTNPPLDVLLIQLDPESAGAVMTWLDGAAQGLTPPSDDCNLETNNYFELRSINPIEANLHALAEDELDLELLDRVMLASGQYDAGSSPQERSQVAQRQVRDGGGQFSPGATDPQGQKLTVFAKGRLPGHFALLSDVPARIDAYLTEVESERSGVTDAPPPAVTSAAEAPAPAAPAAAAPAPQATQPSPATTTVEEATPENTDVRPLYTAIVDAADPEAVLDLVAVIPAAQGANQGPSAWKRSNGKWIFAPEILQDLQSVTPPPVVELPDDSTVKNVIAQIDAHDSQSSTDGAPVTASAAALEALHASSTAARRRKDANLGYALADGSYPIKDVQDLHKAVKAFASASEDQRAAVKKHIIKRGRALKRPDLVPNTWKSASNGPVGMWGPNGEQVPIIAVGDTVQDSPSDVRNTNRLRRYWSHGEGAAKIQWGVGGDWYRCVAHLSKYLGVRAKGYCTLRHHDATGFWPGHAPGEDLPGNVRASAALLADTEFEMNIVQMGKDAAGALVAAGIDMMPMSLDDVQSSGGAFVIPMLIPESTESGDGRSFDPNALTHRDLPLPLLWQIKTGSGHDGSVIVGRIDSIERLGEGGLGNAIGVFDRGPYGQEAERLVRGGFLRGVSADLDRFEAMVIPTKPEKTEDEDDDDAVDEAADGNEEPKKDGRIVNDKINVSQARLMAATLVPKPAFQECYIMMVDEPQSAGTEMLPIEDGVYEEQPDDADSAERVLSALAASAAPVKPPHQWFADPHLDKATPITVDDSGRLFGHIAAWNVDHIGLPTRTRPPRSTSNYAYFRTGILRTEENDDVAVGQLTLAGGHASLQADAMAAVKHYDDTASAVADVAAGEDQYGIWVAGALRPGVTPEQVRVLRASAPSGDWRPINGKLELVAVCQVNVPGFPVARAFVASGAVVALVAAGARYMAELRDHPVVSLAQRVEQLENTEITRQRSVVLARLEPAKRARQMALTAAVAAAQERMAPAREKREALLASAESSRARMRKLKPKEPDEAVIAAVKAPFKEALHPRGARGRFSDVLARLDFIGEGDHRWVDDAPGDNASPNLDLPGAPKDPTREISDSALRDVKASVDLRMAGDDVDADAKIASARTKFESAVPLASPATKAKLSAAVAILDGLTLGVGKDAAELPTADELLPEMPEFAKEIARWALMQAVQALDPTNGFGGAEQIVQKFMERNDPEDPDAVKKLLEQVRERGNNRDLQGSREFQRDHPRIAPPTAHGPNGPSPWKH